MDNLTLNALLWVAKESQQQWDHWESEGDYDRSPEWKVLYRSARDSWTVLHRSIREAEPCLITLENGKTRQIGTVGVLTADLMMYYSEDTNAKYAMQGTSLKFVTSIEKVEDVINVNS